MAQGGPLVVDEPGRPRVQPHAAGGPELLVHRGLDQRMGEADVPEAVVAHLQQARRPTASSRAATTSATSASAAAEASEACTPSTAAASTSRRAAGLQASNRRTTCTANARGAGSTGSQVRQRSAGSSVSKVVT